MNIPLEQAEQLVHVALVEPPQATEAYFPEAHTVQDEQLVSEDTPQAVPMNYPEGQVVHVEHPTSLSTPQAVDIYCPLGHLDEHGRH